MLREHLILMLQAQVLPALVLTWGQFVLPQFRNHGDGTAAQAETQCVLEDKVIQRHLVDGFKLNRSLSRRKKAKTLLTCLQPCQPYIGTRLP